MHQTTHLFMVSLLLLTWILFIITPSCGFLVGLQLLPHHLSGFVALKVAFGNLTQLKVLYKNIVFKIQKASTPYMFNMNNHL